MTVAELIAQLSLLPSDMPVRCFGFDEGPLEDAFLSVCDVTGTGEYYSDYMNDPSWRPNPVDRDTLRKAAVIDWSDR
jgi:hypothetical protein